MGRMDTGVVHRLYANTKEKDVFRKRGIDGPVGAGARGGGANPAWKAQGLVGGVTFALFRSDLMPYS